MRNPVPYQAISIAGMLMLLVFWGCAAGPAVEADRPGGLAGKVQARLIPQVEALYLNSKELEVIYRDLRSVALAQALGGDDAALNALQKTAFYVHKAQRSAAHQWELLAIMEDIRPASLTDYFTLRHKGLGRALNEAVYDERFINIYRTEIRHAGAQRMVDRCLTIIAENRRIFSRMITVLAPLVRRAQLPQKL